MKYKIVELSIVLVGDFNPSIFHPSWLAQKELIKETEAENAEVDIISKNASVFGVDSASFEITPSRFQIKSSQEPYFEALRDLAFSIFKILNETPIRSMGINHIYHYQLNEKTYINVGKNLCPFDRWKGVLEVPRVLKLDMYQHDRNDEFQGSLRVILSPSEKLDKFGFKINVNDHYENTSTSPNGEDLIKILSNRWNKSYKQSQEMTENLWHNLDL